jgi:malto-oligosyltrehalose trehalohydrolase
MKRSHRLPFGAELLADGVRFRLWAPAAQSVAVALDGDASQAMTRAGEGWFELSLASARAGSRYRFTIDGKAVPDPAARFQPDGVHGASEVIDPAAYDWQDGDWRGRRWEEIVLYELHTGAFSESGDFAGIAAHLDHLASLGVTAVEIMPVATFAGARGWGYDGTLLYAPAPCYGRPDDLKRLVDTCHRRGLAVFLDVVYNHFGPEGNYLGLYAPQFFTARHRTPWGDAIDFSKPEVRRFYVENALYWLIEYNLDGLRLDAVHAIRDDSETHILSEIAAAVAERVGTLRLVHLVLENDRNEAWPLARGYRAQWNDDLHHCLHVLATGERSGYYADYAERPVARLGRALAEGFVYQGEPSRHRGGEKRGEPSAHLPPTSFVSFLQNHDQIGNTPTGARLLQIADEESVRLAAAIVLLSPQIPMLFMGEEWGTERPFPYFCDFEGALAQAVREGRKREFESFPGFRGDLPDPCAEATFRAAKLDWDAIAARRHQRWLDWYRGLVATRQRVLVPLLVEAEGGGAYEMLGERALRVSWRLGRGALWTMHANFSERALDLRTPPAGELVFSTVPWGPGVLPPRTALFHLANG